MRGGGRSLDPAIGLLFGAVLALVAGNARGDDAAPLPLLQQRYGAAFGAMYSDPANLDKIFAFANLAAEYNDVEGAIGAYERMLIFNPDLPRVRYDLARLYFRIGSYAVAQQYFEQAAAAPEIPPEIRSDIENYLAQIRRGLASDLITGSIATGLRYQTNANAASTAGIVRVFGINLTSNVARRRDENLFVTGEATYIHDFQSQRGETFEANVSAYGTQQFRVHNLSLATIELSLGPRFPFRLDEEGALGLSVRPYVVGDAAALDYFQFFRAYGGGASLRVAAGPRVQVELDYRYQHRDFFNSTRNPTLSLDTGDLGIARASVNYSVTAKDLIGIDGEFAVDDAVAGFERYSEYGFFTSYARAFPAPCAVTDTSWSAVLRGGRIWRPYRHPDAFVDPDVTRYDRQWQVGVTLVAPINDHFGGYAQLQQDWVRSTLPNFQYTDTSVTLGLNYRF
jgi:tetratricopeptide (TPR) repeat protein